MSATPWNVDAAHSAITFTVRHMVIAKVHGRFGAWKADLALDEQDLSRSTVGVTIDAASIETQVADRDAHLKSADFLDVARHPQIRFSSRRVERAGAGWRVVGDLSIRGVTREVALETEFAGTGKDPWGNRRAGFSARATIDRREFGLTWNAALETGGVLVGEKVEIGIEVEAIAPAAAQAA